MQCIVFTLWCWVDASYMLVAYGSFSMLSSFLVCQQCSFCCVYLFVLLMSSWCQFDHGMTTNRDRNSTVKKAQWQHENSINAIYCSQRTEHVSCKKAVQQKNVRRNRSTSATWWIPLKNDVYVLNSLQTCIHNIKPTWNQDETETFQILPQIFQESFPATQTKIKVKITQNMSSNSGNTAVWNWICEAGLMPIWCCFS